MGATTAPRGLEQEAGACQARHGILVFGSGDVKRFNVAGFRWFLGIEEHKNWVGQKEKDINLGELEASSARLRISLGQSAAKLD